MVNQRSALGTSLLVECAQSTAAYEALLVCAGCGRCGGCRGRQRQRAKRPVEEVGDARLQQDVPALHTGTVRRLLSDKRKQFTISGRVWRVWCPDES